MITNENYFYAKINFFCVIHFYILFCFYSVVGKQQTIDLPKKIVHLTTTESAELDSSNSCAACEAFVTVFEDRLTNDSVNIDDIDMIELCNEVEIANKDQVNTTILVFLANFIQLLSNV